MGRSRGDRKRLGDERRTLSGQKIKLVGRWIRWGGERRRGVGLRGKTNQARAKVEERKEY